MGVRARDSGETNYMADSGYNDKVPEKQEMSTVRITSAELSQNLYRHPDRFAESNREDYVWLRRVAVAKRAA